MQNFEVATKRNELRPQPNAIGNYSSQLKKGAKNDLLSKQEEMIRIHQQIL